MVVWLAFTGAQSELQACQTLREKGIAVLRIARIILSELVGLAKLAPYGIAAAREDCWTCTWSSGEKWQYAPLAARLAQAGIVTCVMGYTIYPGAQVAQMVAETSEALTWLLDHCTAFGGDKSKVTMLGHSAGAHLCAMALLQRLPAVRQMLPLTDAPTWQDSRMPVQFIGVGGCYNIGKHYEYEAWRGVQHLSSMTRAIGGHSQFAQQSPCVILEHCARQLGASSDLAPSSAGLAGEFIAEQVGLMRSEAPTPSASAKPQEPLVTFLRTADPQALADDLRRFPRTHILSSAKDITVPWYESTEFHWRMHACSMHPQSLMYQGVDHAHFVTDWHPKSPALPVIGRLQGRSEQSMAPFVQDIFTLLSH
ncbi:hypothetical protein WJX73_006808 [Symbiochloris irregularis]|uniref:protein-S-isoprenylcysteine alpha-carbonyl methylesterase n=1 Tax=Symbiochloris irregularis TaxID=706552 RepID=A0AAW1NVM6_9CHLO